MTNGEKLKEVFPNMECEVKDHIVLTDIDNGVWFSLEWWNTEYKEPTTKNDLPHCQCTDEEIAKSFIEDVEAVKDQLPCGEQMDFPNTFDEFAEDYGFKDKDEIYTNGSELIPVFRVKQWLEHITPIRPKGHWILTAVEGDRVWYCHCSNCKRDPQYYIYGSENWWLIKSKLPKYCPYCGSDNREVGE